MKCLALHFLSRPLLLTVAILLICETALSLPGLHSPDTHLSLVEKDVPSTTPSSFEAPSNISNTSPVFSTLDKASVDRHMTDVNCLEATGQTSWGRAPLDAIHDGIKYLRTSQGGNMVCGAPPHTCVRISCSWHGGIHLCNNNSYHLRKNCFYIADYAQALVDKCTYKDVVGQNSVGGQAWDIENWNVIVKVEKC
ncbi:hypothetical protein DL98DRAFT_612353, partial [Cadophora sp. DSE1049]